MLPGLSAASLLAGGVRAPAFRNLATLFDGGAVDGVMIDLTDPITLFQDANGAAAVVSNGDPVGLALDQHKWGGKTLTEYRAAQLELQSNGDFASGISGWTQIGSFATLTWDAGNQRLVVTANSGNTPTVGGPTVTGLVIGRWYELSIDIVSATGSGGFQLYVGTSVGNGSMLNVAVATTGNYRRFFKATSTSAVVSVTCRAGSGVVTIIDNVSVKEIDGHHATQSSTARPLWQSASNDVLFDGSNDYLSVVDFDFPSGDCALAAWAKSNTATRAIVGANSSTTSYMILVHNSSNLPVMQVGGSGTVYAGTTAINGVYHTLVIDKNTAEANLLVDGVVEATKTTPGSTAVTRDLAIGAQNANGTLGAYMAGNIKRVFAIHARIRDTMSAADFHENLIAA